MFSVLFLFFFNDTATTEIYTLSLHDALPISPLPMIPERALESCFLPKPLIKKPSKGRKGIKQLRSEEHTSELQSLTNLVCRLLLEKKKKTEAQNCDAQKLLERPKPGQPTKRD